MNSNSRATEAEQKARIEAASRASASTLSDRQRDAMFLAHFDASYRAWINLVPVHRYGTLDTATSL